VKHFLLLEFFFVQQNKMDRIKYFSIFLQLHSFVPDGHFAFPLGCNLADVRVHRSGDGDWPKDLDNNCKTHAHEFAQGHKNSRLEQPEVSKLQQGLGHQMDYNSHFLGQLGSLYLWGWDWD
jgi:hypothetical protein